MERTEKDQRKRIIQPTGENAIWRSEGRRERENKSCDEHDSEETHATTVTVLVESSTKKYMTNNQAHKWKLDRRGRAPSECNVCRDEIETWNPMEYECAGVKKLSLIHI